MPSLGSHLAHAHGLAERLGHPHIEADRGAFYLGSTAPDMRVLMKVDRRRTHFYELDDFGEQDSVARMFAEHPELAAAVSLDPTTRAFVAGYLTHLLMDELYIQDVYRVCFGERSPLGGVMWADVLDRALQYEMNRRELENGAAMKRVRDELVASVPRQAFECLAFLRDDLFPEWREFALNVASQEPTWERFPRMMRIHLRRAGYGDEEIEEACHNAVGLVAEAVEQVSEERVTGYLEKATEVALQRLDAYLPAVP